MRTYLKIESLVTQDYPLLEGWQEDVLKQAGSVPCNLIQDFESQEKAFQLARTARAKHWADGRGVSERRWKKKSGLGGEVRCLQKDRLNNNSVKVCYV
jgi:hypothetical protein